MIKRIESQQNKWIKRLNGLKLKKNRDKEGVFVAEGLRFVSDIPLEWEIEAFFVSDSFQLEYSLLIFEERAAVFILPDGLFAFVSDTEHPQGILAVCKKRMEDFSAIWKKKNLFFLLIEELNDPGNLGTVIRTADACNADAIFLSEGSVDLYHPKVLRATMGSLFHLPIIQDVKLSNLAAQLKEKGIAVYAAHLKGEAYPYSLPLKQSCAFLIGNEARGLKQETAELCDHWVKIPILGQAESLNVSIAAGILMYEVVRQRL